MLSKVFENSLKMTHPEKHKVLRQLYSRYKEDEQFLDWAFNHDVIFRSVSEAVSLYLCDFGVEASMVSEDVVSVNSLNEVVEISLSEPILLGEEKKEVDCPTQIIEFFK